MDGGSSRRVLVHLEPNEYLALTWQLFVFVPLNIERDHRMRENPEAIDKNFVDDR